MKPLLVAALDKEGFCIYVHAFAEGVDDVLEAFAFAAEQNGTRDSRHMIIHVVHPSEEQILKYQQLDVIPVPQPSSRWGTSMMNSYVLFLFT
jgi:predicted amidohydrolase YtcJ